jgi:hypothetical protein
MTKRVNAEAGDYIEDDPLAWEVFVGALRTYCGDIGALREQFGAKGYEIAAGAMLSYLADQHGVYIRRETSDEDDLDDDVIDLRTGERVGAQPHD